MRKIRYLLGWFSFFMSSIVCFADPPPKINTARLLLSRLRGGDYAHAGDKEATQLVVNKVIQLSPFLKEGMCLDVGSGFGGTANDLYQLGFHQIFGIDLDKAAINYSKEHYPHIRFFSAKAQEVSNLFKPDFFSFIYFFNVLYAIEDKVSVLKQLFLVAKPGAVLVIYDYTLKNNVFQMKDLSGKEMYPIKISDIKKDLIESGFQILEVEDFSNRYIIWYKELLQKLEDNWEILSEEFSFEDMMRVKETFESLQEALENGSLGGVSIYAKK